MFTYKIIMSLQINPRWQYDWSVSGLSMKEGKIQVDTLLYALGSDADDVMLSFHLTEDDACN